MSLRVEYDERAIGHAAAFLDDPDGIREVLDAIDRLADEPRPAGAFPYGSADLRRLRVGWYRVLYEITHEDFETARHLTARGVSSAAVVQAATALAAGQQALKASAEKIERGGLLRPAD